MNSLQKVTVGGLSSIYHIIGPKNANRLAINPLGKTVFDLFIGNKKNLTISTKYGFRVRMKSYEYYASGFVFLGETNPLETKVVRKILQRGDNFIDVGAHIGWYTLVASKLVGGKGKIISFEPNLECMSELKNNCKLNKLDNVTLETYALSSKKGTVDFYLGDDMGGSFIRKNTERLTKSKKIKKTTVQCTTLDEYLKKRSIKKVSLIKIDVEGAELLVLKGANNLLKKEGPNLLIEVIEEVLREGSTSKKELFMFLKKLGYSGFALNAGGKITKIRDIHKPLQTANILFSKDANIAKLINT